MPANQMVRAEELAEVGVRDGAPPAAVPATLRST